MKKKKSIKFILLILGTFMLILAYQQNQFKIEVKHNNPELNKPLIIDIQTYKYNKNIDVQNVNVEIFNKYKKDEKINIEVNSYEQGKYNVVYVPQYSGTYIINITVINNNNTYTKNKEVTI